VKIAFLNPPWLEAIAAGPGQLTLRTGIRSGSRWPFTRPAIHRPDQFVFGGYLPFPFFLAHAASFTAAKIPDATVSIRDSIARGESYLSFYSWLHKEAPDWIVIETATPSWDYDRSMLTAIAKLLPAARVILAGTLDEDKARKALENYPNVRAVVRGEFDKQVAKVILDDLRGIVAHDLLTVDEMNAAPAPMFDEDCALHYWDACPVGNRPNQLQLLTSRGCPFKCIFCVWPATMTGNDPDGTKPRAVRYYTAANVVGRIQERIDRAKAKGQAIDSIYLDDDTFNLSDPHALAISEGLARIGIPWSAMCRADTVKRDTWKAMKAAGCTGVKIGFESGCQDVVDRIVNKRLDVADALETAQWLREDLKMSVHGTFTIGLPGETEAEAEETKKFIAHAMTRGWLNSYQLSGTAEIEGTPLHTLRTAGHLKKYERATIDAASPMETDGQKKAERLRQ
jgi:radical SAM superfamily enzyme YgiQ (UPF0313 family)